MRLFNIKNTEKFFEIVNNCEGKVELVSSEGDRLNLKSKLTQYLALAELFSGGKDIPELELVCYNPKDSEKFINFMMNEQ